MDIFSIIKKNLSIETVVSEYTTLKRAGNYLKGRCPFHHEKTASFTISPGKEIFYCFGCHQGGDVIMFVSQLEKCSQREAALLLAERYKITLPADVSDKNESSREKKERYVFVYEMLIHYFLDCYEKSKEAQQYIASRGISKEIRKQFLIGYFPSSKIAVYDLISYAHKQSILTKELIEFNIVMASDGSYYSPFEGRVIIPILDTLGRPCGFGGRTFLPDDTRVKYYNSHESEFFNKGTILFGLSNAKESIRQKKSVFVVEGYMDCILMAQYGYKNTVATLGTACTESHLKQLARYSDILYMTYDGDQAGKKALLRVAQNCWKANVEPMVLVLPEKEDPASYVVKNKTLEPILSTAMNIFLFCISFYKTTDNNSIGEKFSSVQAVLALIASIDDPIKQDILIRQASNSLGVSAENLKNELIKIEKKQVNEKVVSDQKTAPIAEKKAIQDLFSRQIIAMMLHNIQFLDPFVIELCLFTDDADVIMVSKKINQYCCSRLDNVYGFDELWSFFDEQERRIVSLIMTQFDNTIDSAELKQHLLQFKRHMFKKGIYYFRLQLDRAIKDNNKEESDRILQLLVTMQRKFTLETKIS